MMTILNLALPFFGIILAAFIAAKAFRLPEEGLGWLNILIVYLALPAMIFLTVAAAPFEKLIEWPFVLAGIGPEFPLTVVMKLIVHPALVYGLLMMMGWRDPLWLSGARMMAALPTAANAFVLASHYKRYIEGASSSILVTTLISALTLPTLVYAAQQGMFAP